MSPKIIDPHRYKKTTRKKVQKSKEAQKKNMKYKKTKLKNIKDNKKNMQSNAFVSTMKYSEEYENYKLNETAFLGKEGRRKEQRQKRKKVTINFPKVMKIGSLILCIGIISIISRILVNHEKETVVSADANSQEKVTLMQEYDFKIGMAKLDTNDIMHSKNIVLNELLKVANLSLVRIHKDYTIDYVVAKSIEKLSNKEYFIEINPEYNVSVDDVIQAINQLTSYGRENIYYSFMSNIAKVSKQGNTELKIDLKEEDPYFLYQLDFPLIGSSKTVNFSVHEEKEKNRIVFRNQNTKTTLNSIQFQGYEDSDNLIQDFREGKVDLFTATSDSMIQLIGKHDYNVKKYRDGQTIFLFGNKDSTLFSRKEVRQALAYSLNREEIVKEINATFAEVIDIPFIYSDIKIKYDVYGVQNVLLSQGWQRASGMYQKQIENERKTLELNLLVNGNDKTKVKIAEKIKEMAEINGIKIHVNLQVDNALQEHIEQKKYDLILADVDINQVPNITFLQEYIDINNEIHSAIEIVKNSSVEELPQNIQILQNMLSNEIACIGILARNTSVIYQKNINGFDNIGYLKLFSNLEKVGKIQNIQSDSK